MTILDNIKISQNSDLENYYLTIKSFANQINQSWSDMSVVHLPVCYKKIKNVVLFGMGGSALPGLIFKSLSSDSLKVPFEVISEYHPPRYIDKDTLVILSSYSGSTIETLTAARETLTKTDKIFVFSVGGKLIPWSKKRHIPFYDPVTIYNPSGQPRLSLGYSVTMLMALFTNLKLLPINIRTIKKLLLNLEKNNLKFDIKNSTEINLAKQIAKNFDGKVPVLISGPHLVGASIALRNMLHESSKTFAQIAEIPDLNHHMLESLAFPRFVKDKFIFVFINSQNYPGEIKKRFRVTTEVFSKQGNQIMYINLTGDNYLIDAMLLVQLGQYISLYLALLNGVDPDTIVWVDYFKKHLSK